MLARLEARAGAPAPSRRARGVARLTLNTLVPAGLLTAGALVLLYEHRSHVLGVSPWAVLLACPLLHAFGRGGHAGHAGPAPRDAGAVTDRGHGSPVERGAAGGRPTAMGRDGGVRDVPAASTPARRA